MRKLCLVFVGNWNWQVKAEVKIGFLINLELILLLLLLFWFVLEVKQEIDIGMFSVDIVIFKIDFWFWSCELKDRKELGKADEIDFECLESGLIFVWLLLSSWIKDSKGWTLLLMTTIFELGRMIECLESIDGSKVRMV